jgi:hypothetical protein
VEENTPCLWNRIHICSTGREYSRVLPPKNVVLDWFKRSGSLPLHFSIRITSDDESGRSSPIKDSYLNFLPRFSARLYSLEFDTHLRFINNLFSKRRGLSLPSLKEIQFNYFGIVDPATILKNRVQVASEIYARCLSIQKLTIPPNHKSAFKTRAIIGVGVPPSFVT